MSQESNQHEGQPTDDLAEQLAQFDDLLQRGEINSLSNARDSTASELETTILRLERHWPRDSPSLDTADRALHDTTEIGHFQIQREIGRGGFGVVFLARDLQLNRLVALKVPRPEILVDEERQARFASEAEIAAALDHPAIIPVYEANPVGPMPYIASAYCPGPDLGKWLRIREAPVAPHEAAEFIAKLVVPVEYAHVQGVLHRDLKPGNVLLEPITPNAYSDRLADFQPRLADFGLAKLLEDGLIDTRSSLLIGTPHYMAPEQLVGSPHDSSPATDIYALGVLLFELLTMQTPFKGASYIEVVDNIRSQEVDHPNCITPDVPTDLETICLKCLEKDPLDRYASAKELHSDLGRFLGGKLLVAKPLSWRDRFHRWTKRPERIVYAGWYTQWFQLLYVIWMVVTLIIAFFAGAYPEGTQQTVIFDILLVSCTFHLPLSWLGRLVSQGRLGFYWPASLASTLLIVVLVYGLVLSPPAFSYFYPTLHSKVSIFSGMIMGCVLQVGLYLFAMPAWFKQRSDQV